MGLKNHDIQTYFHNGEFGSSCNSHMEPTLDDSMLNFSDTVTPLIVLFGAYASGKTSVLVRLSRYLQEMGYVISPNISLRPTSDKWHKNACEHYMETVYDINRENKWLWMGCFMLVDVYKHGRKICQIFDMPGDLYFDVHNFGYFSIALKKIIKLPNPKVWTIFVEPDWGESQQIRDAYVEHIRRIKSHVATRDKFVFLINKVDRTHYMRDSKHVVLKPLTDKLANQYPYLFELFEETNIIKKIYRLDNCKILPFCSVYFFKTINGEKYQIGPNEFPENLWKSILKRI